MCVCVHMVDMCACVCMGLLPLSSHEGRGGEGRGGEGRGGDSLVTWQSYNYVVV